MNVEKVDLWGRRNYEVRITKKRLELIREDEAGRRNGLGLSIN